jgi:hypothetical protein
MVPFIINSVKPQGPETLSTRFIVLATVEEPSEGRNSFQASKYFSHENFYYSLGSIFRNNTGPKAPACTRHHDSCPHHRHEHPCVHARPRPQLSDTSEDEGYDSDTSQTRVHNECALHPPKIERYGQKYSSDTPKYTHYHATSLVSGACARTTVHTSHTNGGGSNIKCVRFSDEEVSRTVTSLYSAHGSQSSADHLCHASQQYARPHPAKDSSESRPCSRTVWGPPPPETYSRRYERGFRSGH